MPPNEILLKNDSGKPLFAWLIPENLPIFAPAVPIRNISGYKTRTTISSTMPVSSH